MTATERLRALLDERGVEYVSTHPVYTAWWGANDLYWSAMEVYDGELDLGTNMSNVTPEQAIAATLGDEDAYTREDVEGAFVSGYSLGCLPVGSDPQWDENRQTVDEHMAEWGWVRKEATLGAGTCHNVHEPPKNTTFWPSPHFKCSECGATHVSMEYVFYCPNCGRKVVDA